MSRNTVPEYRYINYDLDLIKKEYEVVSKKIMEMQMALDRYNQTVQFEVNMYNNSVQGYMRFSNNPRSKFKVNVDKLYVICYQLMFRFDKKADTLFLRITL